MKIFTFAALALLGAPLAAQAQQPQLSGEQIVRSQCVKCHETGAKGAPKIGDRADWIHRGKDGIDALVFRAMRGHGKMPARGGMAGLTDAEFRAAVLYMFNAQQPLTKK
jgi:cytochrome c5